ncbi:tetratricopeptide TPR_1 repeat-containing protein [Nostoc linckia z18]|uniref:Tetratricopeptide TPR_1 repeat-containing protein n=2 Tax=Nostoc linckia TaxID=92942 RepID=A0A9Q6EI90_NOSLI|nr:CHAT domain-containing tetratricopeptide repeat protein [Nostoc linckia]PHK34028.1 tetratricopeptide TPR_1 repeat-containing protein [Nostoc linckia z15]PHJ58206.1 tetratricopeptide TPR_1 repeat-containing protein [Nostoc linckia z2]PHJ62464.1 tetratricopeptide TPR_1 repeat-containing protein [Nostoc linckia z1]PHJ71577.1 tetratricopeptide TPR_1 repeat-containing protein [Nostoc linckia z3]PHJ73058.1 tetratricopeptide TPR_1 repeat-containing protein [Nostoc linckia z4]
MTQFQISDSRQWKFLPFVASGSVVLFSSFLLFTESNIAIAQEYPLNIAQQTSSNDAISAAANALYKEGKQLYEQGTGESLLKAIAKFEQALPLYQKIGDRSSEAFTVAHLGKIYSDLGQQQKALFYLNQALLLRRQIKDKMGETITLNNIGSVYSDIGELQKALDFFHQALLIKREIKDKTGEARIINNIGNVYINSGEEQKALDYFQQSLIIRREVGDKIGEARTINNIGLIYLNLGQQQKAIDYFNQSLALNQEMGDKLAASTALNNIATIYSDLQQEQKALEFLQKSLVITKSLGNKSGEARTLNNIGNIYSKIGEKQKALDYFNQSLPLFESVENKLGLAANLNNIGLIYSDLGEQPKALNYYQQALSLYQKVGNRGGEALAIYNMASAERKQGNLNSALNQIKIVINIVEDLRTKINSQELRASYFATVQNYYQFYIDLLMQMHKQQPSKGYDALALQTSERARARSLLEMLTEAKADIRQGVEPKLLSQERDLQKQIDVLEKRRIQLLGGNYTKAQVQTLEKENEAVLEQYQQVQIKIRATSPRYAALTQPQPLSLAQIQQQVLDENTLLLEYSLGEQRSYLWAVTNKSITSYELPKRAEIEAIVQKFRQEITTPYLKHSPSLDTLSQIILAPVAPQLQNKRLVVVSDGALQYVPFAALTKPNSQKNSKYEPLLINHEIITLPSASTVAILRNEHKQRKPVAKTLIVLADPIFSLDDERLQSKVQTSPPVITEPNLNTLALNRAAKDSEVNFERLKFTRHEAEQILALVPPNKAKSAFDFTASRNTATSKDLSQYNIIHFATHGILNSKHPELSGIVLSLFDDKGMPQNGFLRLHDVFNLNLKAELVVLSACKTGLGEEVRGEGLVGLTRGFMYAGSPRVVVSLWSVDDQATSELMKAFYQKMLQQGLKPAAALRTAQLEIWRTKRYAAPYYWAAFTLQGEWR